MQLMPTDGQGMRVCVCNFFFFSLSLVHLLLRSHHSGLGVSSSKSPTKPDCAGLLFYFPFLVLLTSKRLYVIRVGSISSQWRWYFSIERYLFSFFFSFSISYFILFVVVGSFFLFRDVCLDFQETQRERGRCMCVCVVLDWRCQANNVRRRPGAGISAWCRYPAIVIPPNFLFYPLLPVRCRPLLCRHIVWPSPISSN